MVLRAMGVLMSLPVTLPDGLTYPSLAAAARALGLTREAMRRRVQREPDAYQTRGDTGATCVPDDAERNRPAPEDSGAVGIDNGTR